ncbi:PAS domain-containing protein [Terrimonas sp. NA20]|uniref:histidine kinase n=1 Tax=Terrimonas ginsenosidimutans TaxID=2908004 RepID=A0ABS9KRZ6_9BACT|nr:PAS domain-containing sensor histidine kinase [Terrimonas ginsenosidimutans]MCG2615098.1 PAS domain-containing protein [Terrimonas ginsenosidimutans]
MTTKQPTFLSYPGEMAGIMRKKDWTNSPLGPPAKWPLSLQTALGIILHSKFPMFIWWGPELRCFYNDAYRPSLGKDGKHPSILGEPAAEAWAEIWPIIYPLIKQVLDGGEATWSEDQLVPIYRNASIEDVYWTFSYSRLNNDEGDPFGILVTCVETTEKVLGLRELKETNNLLQFATEAADLGTWDYDPLTGTFMGNARLKSWFGLGPEHETDLGLAISSIAAKDRQRVIESIEAALDYDRQLPYDLEYTIVHPVTGVETIVLVKGRPFFDENRKAYRFSGTMEDITEKSRTRQLMAESEQNLSNLVEQAPVAMCVLKGPQHIVAIANERMIRLWGKPKKQVMHRPIFDGLPDARGQGLEDLLDKVYATGTRFTAQERPVELLRDGAMETVYQNFVYEPLRDSKGEIEGVIAVTIDVTEQVMARLQLEEAEERARLATEAANLGTFDFNIIGATAITSPRFLEIFDADASTPHAELVNRIHPEDRPIRERAHKEALQTGRLFYEARIIHHGGAISWVRIEGRVIVDKAGTPVRIVGTALDFTEHRELEQKREEMIAIASHELRNPMTSLRLALDLLSVLLEPRDQRLLLEKAQEQVRRLIAMTTELLNVSKITAGELDLKPEIVNLHRVIEDSIATAHAGTRSNLFSITGASDINIRADRFRIEQVLVNLLSNAVKYSPRDSEVIIDVSLNSTDIKVCVTDKGIGIEPDKTAMVFKKFTRVDATRGIEGYGLGLYISEQIMRAHGGQIGVESEKGIGSTFWFTLPR